MLAAIPAAVLQCDPLCDAGDLQAAGCAAISAEGEHMDADGWRLITRAHAMRASQPPPSAGCRSLSQPSKN